LDNCGLSSDRPPAYFHSKSRRTPNR
jgi:hypothetical protein